MGGNKGKANEQYMVGKPVKPTEKTLDMALDPNAYLGAIVDKFGINMKGSKGPVDVIYDSSLGVGTGKYGVTKASEGGFAIRVGPDAVLQGEAQLANTLAHELSHARDYQRGMHKPHGDAFSIGDNTPYGSGNALQQYIEGKR
jgi:hypothetical protein